MFKNSLVLFAVFAGFFFLRMALTPLAYDDYSYSFIWDGAHGGNIDAMQFGSPEIEHRERVDSFGDIVRSMQSHYFTWGGRVFAHSLVQFFLWVGKPIFDIANTMLFIALTLLIIKLAAVQSKISRPVLLWIFFSLFIVTDCSILNIFMLTGSCNYMWMAFFQLLFLLPYVKALSSRKAFNSPLLLPLMILLGLCAGCSNEAGSLATICLTIFLIIMCKTRAPLQSWTIAGLTSLIVGSALMILAPGNFARLDFAHPNFAYTAEIFFEHLTGTFLQIFGADLIALLPMFLYFFRRNPSSLNTSEILMLAFAATSVLIPAAMLFSPEFSTNISVNSVIFALVAASNAILELQRSNFTLKQYFPKKFLRRLSTSLIIVVTLYFATLLYVDFSVFNAVRHQVQYIQRNAELDLIKLPPMPICSTFIEIHGEKSSARWMKYLSGIRANPNNCRNSLIAQYYGAKKIIATD